ncbi:hypothetical protein [Sulfurimonas sp. HSL-1716]|uniref:hypothetical protein n=1 Tax=Hydrocurvibacter sulfurireducens TaxID=3131937 RepID=UPI0031F7D9AF
MFTKYKQKAEMRLIGDNVEPLQVNVKANIILPPSFYWFKKLSLPVKSVHKIKKLLPSLFESFIPPGEYSYSVYKEGEFFYAFAYDDKAIIDQLAKKGLLLTQIEGVYFAQSEFSNSDQDIILDDAKVLHVKDGTVITIPREWVKDAKEIDLTNFILSKHKINLKEYGHIIKTDKLYKFAVVLLIFTFITFGKYFFVHHEVQEIQEKYSRLFTQYSLLPTMMQNRSVLKHYESVYKRQIKLRQIFAQLISLKLPNGVKLSAIKAQDKTVSAEFTAEDVKSIDALQNLLSKITNVQVQKQSNVLHVEAAL